MVIHRVEIWRCEAEVVAGRLLFNHYQEKSPSSVHFGNFDSDAASGSSRRYLRRLLCLKDLDYEKKISGKGDSVEEFFENVGISRSNI